MYMDLSKAFDTINHDLLLAKLRAYSFSTSALNLLYSYLKNRTQKAVINNKTSSSEVTIAGVPQGSDNSLYAIGNDKEETKTALVKDIQTVINWFYENHTTLNTGKCRYMCMGKDMDENETLQISNQQKMINSKVVKVLAIKK